jgi:hypothetical protein
MTTREMMGLHAEIMSLRETLGISYKDASHRLYMAEWDKVKTDERTHKAFSILSARARDALNGFQTQLNKFTPEVKSNTATGSSDSDAEDDADAAADGSAKS